VENLDFWEKWMNLKSSVNKFLKNKHGNYLTIFKEKNWRNSILPSAIFKVFTLTKSQFCVNFPEVFFNLHFVYTKCPNTPPQKIDPLEYFDSYYFIFSLLFHIILISSVHNSLRIINGLQNSFRDFTAYQGRI